MGYVVRGYPPFLHNNIYPGGLNCLGLQMSNCAMGAPASTAWPTANLAIYMPFTIELPQTVYQVGWHNGASPGDTHEVGVYTAAGGKIVTGAATGSGASVLQLVDVTDTVIGPGQYWLAALSTGVTAWYAYATPVVLSMPAAMGVLTEATGGTLPTTATFAKNHTLTYIPFAFLVTRSVF